MRLFTLGLLAGTLVLQFFNSIPPLLWTSLLLACLLAVFLVGRTVWPDLSHHPYSSATARIRVVFVGLMTGFLLASVTAQYQIDSRIPAVLEGRDLIVEGIIEDIPEQFDSAHSQHGKTSTQASSPGQSAAENRSLGHAIVAQGQLRLRLAVDRALDQENGRLVPLKGLIRISWYKDWQPIQAGEHWRFRVRLKQPAGFMNPGGFDYEKWLFSERIVATGYVRDSSVDNRRLEKAPWWSVQRIRQIIHETIRNRIEDKNAAAVLSALSVASRNDLSEKQWETLKSTGTSHLVAISGLHIAIIAGFAFLPVWGLWRLFPRLNEKVPVRLAGAVAAMFCATGYALLAGFNLPTQRALIMVVVALTGLLLRRHDPPSSLLAFALLAVLLFDPLAAMTISFWLSFIAVALILWITQRRIVSSAGALRQLVALQLLLSFGLFPVTLIFFGSGSLVSPLANLLAIPWVSFVVVPLNLLAVLFIPLNETFSDALFYLAALTVDLLFLLLNWLAALPLSSLQLSQIPFSLLLLGFCGFVLLIFPAGFPGRWLGLVAMVPAFVYQADTPADNDFHFTLLDAGQGMASVVQTRRHTLLYDAGKRVNDRFDVGRLVVLPYLQSRGIERVDSMVISHEDLDHRGGAAAVLDSIAVDQVISSDDSILPGVRMTACKAGERWYWDGVLFEFLSPSYESYSDRTINDNNRSCVLRISNRSHSLLLTGDIEVETEKWLQLNAAARLASSVMIVPHHGSKTSSGINFIRAVDPKLALVPAGYRNRFGHPKASVLMRYQHQGVDLMSTVQSGAIEMEFPAGSQNYRLRAYRTEKSRFWNRQGD